MPLVSKLFTVPRDPKLEACLISDPAHVTPGSIGDHVKRIQIALNQLSNVFLRIDGNYGPKTAAAVKAFKSAPNRRILGPGQTTADDIVGKKTIKRLDDEMDILENELTDSSLFISTTSAGAPHDHGKCPTPPRVTGDLFNGHADHLGTPINPKRVGRQINIFGEGETDYLGFRDFATELQFANGRPLTSTLPDNSASDICLRSSPLSAVTQQEIKRLARPALAGGCRFTFATNAGLSFTDTAFIRGLGVGIEHASLKTNIALPDNPANDMEVFVIEIRK
jgi:peptidoglycan hydrolase-like protein with peptidoglycan-binding domain